MKSGRRILIITPGFPSCEADSTCIPAIQDYLSELIRQQPDAEISVVALHYPFAEHEYLWNGIRIYPCNGRNRKWPWRLIVWITALCKMNRLIKLKKIQLVHSFWLGEAAWIASFCCRLFNLPHICTAMGQDILSKNNYLKWLPFKKIHVVVFNPFTRDILLCNARVHEFSMIPHGISTVDVPERDATEHRFDVLGAGALISLKNWDDFVRTLSMLKSAFPNIRGAIAGDGPLHSHLLNLIESLDLHDNISLLGRLGRSDLLRLMTQSRVLLHPSVHESFGGVFAEALHCGMAVVSRSVGAYIDIEQWSSATTPDQMAARVAEFLNNPPPPYIGSLFKISQTAREYRRLYDRMMMDMPSVE